MRARAALLVACALGAAGCVRSEVPRPEPAPGPDPLTVVLAPDVPQPLILPSGPVTVTLAGVADSRCPKGARCVQAGEGRITLAILGEEFGAYRLELSTTDAGPVYLNRLGCRLEGLEPYPVLDPPSDPEPPRATVLFYGAALPPEPESESEESSP